MPAKILRGHRPDYAFLGSAILIVLAGLIFLASASSAIAIDKFGDSYYYLKHQLLYGLVPGIVMFFAFAHLPYQRLRALALPCLIVTIVSLVLVLVPGLGFNYGGATRWIKLGPVVVQPS